MKLTFTATRLMILLCINVLTINVFAADKLNSHTLYPEDSYRPGILVFKVKDQYRSLCANDKINVDKLNNALSKIAADNLAKKFPRQHAPEQLYNSRGEKFVDLSLIYQIQFSSVIRIEQAISIVKATGAVEYVEPLFVRHINFTPNDPFIGAQYALGKINAYAAFDVWTGDTNVVIGIVDSGTDWNHPDLQGNIKYNYADPIDGIDNDNDGFTDNFRGWDVSDNDNDPMVGNQGHGSHVSGCAAAVTNNAIGVASPGYNCKFLPVKAAFNTSGSSIDNPMDGITYAADHGANVINCSFGGGFFSQAEQDVVNYVTINKDALVVASAGNGYVEEQSYPASYENVISVAATKSNDTKAGFSSYGSGVDVCAPGQNIYATYYNDTYDSLSGTSMSSPIAAGCAAMIKSRFPSLTARQVGEQLRTTCDNINSVNSAYIGKLGKGRVNLYKALTDSVSPGVIVKNTGIRDGNDNVYITGDTLSIVALLENLLRPTTNLTCTLSTTSSYVQVLQSSFTAGVMNTFDTTSNYASAYRVYIRPSAPVNSAIALKLTLNDGTWSDIFQIDVVVNVDYINVAINNVATSITSKSQIGYNQAGQQAGLGFTYMNGPSMLYDMELMVGEQNTQVSDNVRSTAGNNDADFTSYFKVSSQQPGVVSDFDVNGSFKDDGATSATPLNILVSQHAYAWVDAPNDNYIMVHYNIKNIGTVTLSNTYAGLFADWDIDSLTNNKCSTDAARRMGYVYSTDATGLWGGIKLLSHTGGFNHNAIDNIDGAGGILMTDGFTEAEKFTSLSTLRTDAGQGSTTGNDVISVVSSGSFTLAAGDSVDVAFALIAGPDLASIQASADAAQLKYDSVFVGLVPVHSATTNELQPCFPNPSSREIRISFSLGSNSTADLSIYNSIGEKVKTIVNETLNPGKYSVTTDISGLPAGNYFYKLIAGNYSKTLPVSIVH